MPSGVPSVCLMTLDERSSELAAPNQPKTASLSYRDYILDRFAAGGSDKTYNDRDFGSKQKVVPFCSFPWTDGQRHMSTCANLDSNLVGPIAHVNGGGA